MIYGTTLSLVGRGRALQPPHLAVLNAAEVDFLDRHVSNFRSGSKHKSSRFTPGQVVRDLFKELLTAPDARAEAIALILVERLQKLIQGTRGKDAILAIIVSGEGKPSFVTVLLLEGDLGGGASPGRRKGARSHSRSCRICCPDLEQCARRYRGQTSALALMLLPATRTRLKRNSSSTRLTSPLTRLRSKWKKGRRGDQATCASRAVRRGGPGCRLGCYSLARSRPSCARRSPTARRASTLYHCHLASFVLESSRRRRS